MSLGILRAVENQNSLRFLLLEDINCFDVCNNVMDIPFFIVVSNSRR